MLLEQTLGRERLLSVSGTCEERAFQQGQAFSGLAPQLASTICSFFIDQRLLPASAHRLVSRSALRSAGAYYMRKYRPTLQQHAEGKYWRGLEAMARGAGTSRAMAFGLSHLPEILSGRIDHAFPPAGCTTVALAPQANASGSTAVIHNHDFPARLGPYLFLRRSVASDAYRSLTLNYPFHVGTTAGVNEAGLVIVANAAFVTDFVGGASLLISNMLQECLDRYRTVDETIAAIENRQVPVGAIVTLADERGNRAVVELSCTRSRTRRDEGPVMVSFNKFKHPQMTASEVPVGAIGKGMARGINLHETNLARQRRFDELIARGPARLAEADILALMGDHEGGVPGNNTLCRHFPMGDTLATMIIDASRRAFRVSFGRACEARYRDVLLDAPAAQRSRPPAAHPATSSATQAGAV